jgi:hypothetical protein
MSVVKAGTYLRSGMSVAPGVMTLEGLTLSFKTDKGTVFEAPLGELRAKFSRYGTLTIYKGAETYVFVTGGYAGAFAPRFTDQQLQEIAAGENSVSLAVKAKGEAVIFPPNNPTHDIGKLLNGGKGYGLTGMMLAELQRRAFYITLAWVEYLQAQGLQVDIRARTFGKSLLTITLVLLVSLAVFGVAVYMLLSLT